jgi:hypothetical protein
MDKFHEQLLRTQKNALYRLLSIYMYVSIFLVLATVMLALSGAFRLLILTVLFAGTYFFARIMRDRQYREYEYIFTNGNLQIDVIYNMKKRKTLYDVDIKDLEEFGKESEVNPGNNAKRVICFPWSCKEEKYILLMNKSGKQAVYIAPNEELLKLIKIYNVRRPR